VAYADTAANYYVKLVADFDGDERLRLYNNQFSMSTFSYTFQVSIDAAELDKTEGWHYMKVEVETLVDSTVAYTCYYDNQDLGTYIDDAEERTLAGQAGVFSFLQNYGLPGYFDNIMVSALPVGIDDEREMVQPSTIYLTQNYPNPFNPGTTIEFSLDRAAVVHLAVYDIQGRLIRTLENRPLSARNYRVYWDGRDAAGMTAPTGLYLYTLTAGDEYLSRKMMLVK